jgi:L-lactate dehydrogenase complex protein LldF
MYVILLDNGRTRLLADSTLREALRCIRCGACLNACPVYKSIGGHSYSTTYPGPIGAVITPPLKGETAWAHLSFASSLCGACSSVCPVGINLHHLLLENRERAVRAGYSGPLWGWGFSVWGTLMRDRRLLELVRPLLRIGTSLLGHLLPLVLRKREIPRPPALAKKSFSQLWQEQQHGS